ncbi:cytochrome P450 family protein [Hyaloscypha variabilis F]|uniref:Cytochrome P450 family protein n=1 Tax=Hyaloscypha variabilis (strain UAMH 11265 / GT02V1 / F) TaxID=1149755 RepID=A0A2J6R457_HYAVF|nr:cytochrome P450 family protein [Hyaloscypha variabilis F]
MALLNPQNSLFLVLISFCSLPALYLIYSTFRALSSPLRGIPGPFLARFTRFWKLREIYKGSFEKTNIKLHQKYGQIVRIAPNEYSIDDPEAVKIIYGLGSKFVKSPWYIASGNADPHAPKDLFTDRNPTRHAANRRKVASAYSMTALAQLEPFVDECSSILRTSFVEFANQKKTINMAHWMQCYAFDVVGEITVAKRFGFLNAGEDIDGIMRDIHKYLIHASHVGVYSELHRPISKVLSLFRRSKGISATMQFTQNQLQSRLSKMDIENIDSKGDFLSKLLRLHADNPEKVTMTDVFMTCMTNIGAGSDTTGISLSAVIYYLCKYPEVMRKLRNEIDGLAEKGEISDPVTFAQAQRMPYLQAVLKEALRMHPATGLPLGRVVPEGGAVIARKMFPAGAVVGVNSWVAHANTDVFGLDASVFRPERWLVDKDRYNGMDKYFFAFGMGSRTCIGKNISLLEMTKLIPQLVRNFDFELAEPGADWKTVNVWFVKQTNFNCRIKLRTSL